MTREEAIKKLPLSRWYGDDAQRGYLLDALIALGLLTLDEPKKPDYHARAMHTGAMAISEAFDMTGVAAVAIMKELEARGLRFSFLSDPDKLSETISFNWPNIRQEAKARLSEARSNATKWSSENTENLLEYWCAWAAHQNAVTVMKMQE